MQASTISNAVLLLILLMHDPGKDTMHNGVGALQAGKELCVMEAWTYWGYRLGLCCSRPLGAAIALITAAVTPI